jgi:2-oxoglutarate ferredoxin oxidoreductase subunit beta
MALATSEFQQLTRKDFVSDQEVRWCPGCGDYAILAQMQRVLPELGIPREQIVFISGIGCSSRFPYYMNTYGVHSIHGRAPTLASGLKVANPDLHVWVITGDGDGLSIGGNHLLHILRRNVNVNIILFNNRIYGLTKGQYSPTSLPGHKTYSSPMGSIEQSFNPISVAIGAEATFVARSVDRNTKHLAEMLRRAAAHKGTSFVEIYQNCNIYNDGAWFHITEADVKDDNTLIVEHGQPMIFGKEHDKGIRLNGLGPEVVKLGNGTSENALLVHDETADPPALAYMLSRMEFPNFPVPLGVLRCVERPVYEDQILAQGREAVEQLGDADLSTLYQAADTWIVSEEDSVPAERDVVEEEISTDIPEIIPGIGDEDPLAPKSEFQHLVINPISTIKLHIPEFIAPGASMLEAMALMEEKDAGCLLVSEDGVTLQGILAEGDFFMKVVGNDIDLASTPVEDVMTPNPITMKLADPIGYALHLMDLHGYRHIPVVDPAGRAVKVVSFRAALEFFTQLYDNGHPAH